MHNRKKLLRSIFVTAGVLILLLGFSFYQATRWVPPFYAETLALDARVLAIAENEMEQRILNLQNDVLNREEWHAVFRDEEINGWLAGGLRKKFPHAIPNTLRSPRVAISSSEAMLACQYTDHHPPTVISLVVDVFLTQQQNVIGLRLKSTRFGAVPGFMDEVVSQLTHAAQRSRVPLRWTQIDGDPVALVSLPPTMIDRNCLMTLSSLELREGSLYIAGRTKAIAKKTPHVTDRRKTLRSE